AAAIGGTADAPLGRHSQRLLGIEAGHR
ncbi:MAG: hypothetical protein K0R61_5098, partial [Microvirga sp.]|nr:hypothetical protein [Microvirga sp.]